MIRKNGKLVAVLLMVFVMTIALAGCGNTQDTSRNDSSRTAENGTDTQGDNAAEEDTSGGNTAEKEEASSGDTTEKEDISDNGKILVAYFSHTGNTKKIAEEIQEKTGGDIFEIKTVNEYSSDYNTVLDEAKAELNDSARPELRDKVENMDQYGTVIIGYPIWWGDMPMAVYTFLDEYDLSGKSVLPFCTHGGSGLSGTDGNIQQEEKDAKVADGLAISDSSLDDAGSDIDKWLKDNGAAK